MKKNVINGAGVSGLKVEFSTFNIYKLKELQMELNKHEQNRIRREELNKLGFDKMTKKQQEEWKTMQTCVSPKTIENIRIFLNNLLADFGEENDDLFTETTPTPNSQA